MPFGFGGGSGQPTDLLTLAQSAPRQQQGGGFNFGQKINDNYMGLLLGGLAALDTGKFSDLGQGFAQGAIHDSRRRDKSTELAQAQAQTEEAKQKRLATIQLLIATGAAKSPQEADAIYTSGMAEKYVTQALKGSEEGASLGLELPPGFSPKGAQAQEFAALTAAGVPRQDALDRTSGLVKEHFDPVSQQWYWLDTRDQTYKEMSPAEQQQTAQTQPIPAEGPVADPGNLFDAAKRATGPGNFIGDVADRAGSLAGLDVDEKRIEAKTRFNFFKRDLGRALAISPRFAEGDQKRILDMIPDPGPLTGTTYLEPQLRALRDELAQQKKRAYREKNDRAIPRSEQAKAKADYDMLLKFEKQLEEPKKKANSKQKPPAPVRSAPEGVDPQDWEWMTPEERAVF